MASVPKRETSRRRAKDTAKRTNLSLNTGDDEEDIQDIDLEDSDDDASWTPFKVCLTIPMNSLQMNSAHDNQEGLIPESAQTVGMSKPPLAHNSGV